MKSEIQQAFEKYTHLKVKWLKGMPTSSGLINPYLWFKGGWLSNEKYELEANKAQKEQVI